MRPIPNVPRRPAARAVLTILAVCAGLAAAATASAQVRGPETLGFKKRFFVEITNPSPLALENHAVVIDVAAIRASVAPDFNTYYYAFFEEQGPELALVVSQADDFDKDRYHDEIVVVRSLPASSTMRLACWYTPERSFQLMPANKAFARGAWQSGDAEAAWESNLAAYKFVHGRIGFYGKLQPGLVLGKFPAAEAKSQDWGMDVLGTGDAAGLGGLSLWDGAKRVPLFGPGAPLAKLTVVVPGPVRAMVKAEYPAVSTADGEVTVTVFYSTFADSAFSRQDVVLASQHAGPIAFGPALQILDRAAWSFDKVKGCLSVWGKGSGKSGEIGLAAIFPPAALTAVEETAADRALKLDGRAGRTLTYWVAGGWERGAAAPASPGAQGWARHVEDLAARLLVPVKVEFKAK